MVPIFKQVNWFALAFLMLTACGGAQKTTKKNSFEKDSTVQTEPVDTFALKDTVTTKRDSIALLYPIIKKDTYRVDFLLPLYLSSYPKLSGIKKVVGNIALDMWWGAKLALDTLESIGFSGKIQIHDTENDSTTVSKIFTDIKGQTDLIYGPLFSKNISYLSDSLLSDSVNLISPLARIDSCVNYNYRTIFSSPSERFIRNETAQLILKVFDSKRPLLLFARNSTENEKDLQDFKKLLPDSVQELTQIKLIDGSFLERNSMKEQFPDSANAVIFSDREAFVTSVIAEIQRSLKDFSVMGREKWLDFQSMDTEAWEKLNMHFLSTQNIHYQDTLLINFIKRYRRIYKEEPSKYAIAGYSETLFYLLYLQAYGVNFQRFFNELDLIMPHKSFSFSQINPCKAYHNTHLFVLKFDNNRLVEVE